MYQKFSLIYIQEKNLKQVLLFCNLDLMNSSLIILILHIFILTVQKDDMRVGCAVVSDNYLENMRIPDGSSIFTAEAIAIDLALDFFC